MRPAALRLAAFRRVRPSRALLAGWFSLPGGATVGDVEALRVVRRWLTEKGVTHDLALAEPLGGGLDWRSVRPERYSHLLLVCGPVWEGSALDPLLERFAKATRVGVGVSMLANPEAWPVFDVLLERDGLGVARVDLSVGAEVERVPVVGTVLLKHEQREYGARGHVAAAHDAVERLLRRANVARVEVDTRLLDERSHPPNSPERVESLLARLDAVVTTRMHGLALALKNGVPVLAVDTVAGGAKVAAQARALGWSQIHAVESLQECALVAGLEWCLTDEAREVARRCAASAAGDLARTRESLLALFD